jgi:hypothetical protein
MENRLPNFGLNDDELTKAFALIPNKLSSSAAALSAKKEELVVDHAHKSYINSCVESVKSIRSEVPSKRTKTDDASYYVTKSQVSGDTTHASKNLDTMDEWKLTVTDILAPSTLEGLDWQDFTNWKDYSRYVRPQDNGKSKIIVILVECAGRGTSAYGILHEFFSIMKHRLESVASTEEKKMYATTLEGIAEYEQLVDSHDFTFVTYSLYPSLKKTLFAIQICVYLLNQFLHIVKPDVVLNSLPSFSGTSIQHCNTFNANAFACDAAKSTIGVTITEQNVIPKSSSKTAAAYPVIMKTTTVCPFIDVYSSSIYTFAQKWRLEKGSDYNIVEAFNISIKSMQECLKYRKT